MNRGEVWTVAGGVYSSKPRPAVIIQDDAFSETNSVTVAPLTTTLLDAPLLRLRVMMIAEAGVANDSDVMVDKITTVRRSHVGQKLGRLTNEQMVELERLLMTFLGMAR